MKQFELCKVGNRWAIFDKTARVFYFGPKKNLIIRLKELNK